MVEIDALLLRIARSHYSKPKHLFHFTSTANLVSIRDHGLLSQQRIVESGLQGVDYASDETSRYSDRRKQLDRYVHLCFFEQHRMAHVAEREGRIAACSFVRVAPAVLSLPGVLLSMGAANRDEIEIGDVVSMIPKLDWEVIYSYTVWKDPEVRQRRNDAQMYEILVPEAISIDYLEIP